MDSEANFRQFTELRLGISDIAIELQTRNETCFASVLMAQQCMESLEIFSRDFDPDLYDRSDFLQTISDLCINNRKARVRILVQNPAPSVQRGHRMIELARRLSSSIEIRQPHPDYRHHNEAFLIADRCGLIVRGLADRFEGVANFYTPISAQRKLDFFTEVWDRSEVHPDFRRLHL
jgi:hypothetical protein